MLNSNKKRHNDPKIRELKIYDLPAVFHRGVAARLFKHFKNIMVGNGVRMLLIDTEAGNHPALKFFNKMGFSNSQGHIYLSLNLSDQRRHGRGRSNNRPGLQAV